MMQIFRNPGNEYPRQDLRARLNEWFMAIVRQLTSQPPPFINAVRLLWELRFQMGTRPTIWRGLSNSKLPNGVFWC